MFRRFLFFIALLFLLQKGGIAEGYLQPPEDIIRVFDAYPADYMIFETGKDIALEYRIRPYPALKDVIEETLPLAGVRISPVLNGRRDLNPIVRYSIYRYGDHTSVTPAFPKGGTVRKLSLHPDGTFLAVLVQTDEDVEVMLTDTKSGKTYPLKGIKVNTVFGDDAVQWSGGGKLLIRAIPRKRPALPTPSPIPDSPVIQEAKGERSVVRTYQNLLKNPFDEKQFDYYFTSELVLADPVTKCIKKTGINGIIDDAALSPDGKYLFYSEIVSPYSYKVPWYYFPRHFKVFEMASGKTRLLHKRPLQENIPMGGTYEGPRSYHWKPTSPHTLVWVEALDGGDPEREAAFRDQVLMAESPMKEAPILLTQIRERFSGITWGEEDPEYVVYEFNRKKLWFSAAYVHRERQIEKVIIDQSIRDIYNSLGDLVTVRRGGGNVFVKNEGALFFINTKGATPEGNRPFVARYDLESGEKEYLYRSREGYHETPLALLGKDFDTIVIASETSDKPRNYYLFHTDSGTMEPLSDYPDPYEGLISLKKEPVRYERKDGIDLSGTLYLPPGYQGDKPLPLFIWAYPEEYRDSSTAGQADYSPHRFTRIWGDSPLYLAMAGYAVLYDASIPIVGDAKTVNDTFIEQTVDSVRAAVDYLAERGIADPERVAIGGHSYGAFMTANVLAHSDICRAGIARSGAYNRTLTPFGFQSEERTLWEAADFYFRVSPFMYAHQIQEPLLLIHGELDPNSGTFPLQSERMFDAVKGNGGVARFVLLPGEGHGYSARESKLHVLAEMILWLNNHL
ncbi:MAG TPA: S9 family peptidase [Firmicutes bacterium]|nr:S9 family peptidase [Bacillota bacterium]